MIQSQCNTSPLDQSTSSVVSSSSSYNSVQASGGEPKRPLSAYNIFFIYQRKRIVDDVPSDRVVTMEEVLELMEHQRIVRSLSNKPKRLHRKTHGKISFREMARSLAEKWKILCPIEKQIYYNYAEAEKQHYVTYKKQFDITMNQNNTVTTIDKGDNDEPAIISDDSSRSDRYSGASVVTTTVPQIVQSNMSKMLQEVSDEYESIPSICHEDNDNVVDIYQDDEIDNDLSYDLYKSRQVIQHNLNLIQYQKVKLRRVKLQMNMIALNQRKLQLIMKQKQRMNHNSTMSSSSSSSLESMKRKQQQQKVSMIYYPSSNTEWTNPTMLPSKDMPMGSDNSMSMIGDTCWNLSTPMNNNQRDFNSPNDLLHEISETTNINDVHRAADQTYISAYCSSLNQCNAQDDDDDTDFLDDLIANSDDLVEFVNGFQDNDKYYLS